MRHRDYDEIRDAQSSLDDHGIHSPGLFQFGLPEDPHYTGIMPDTRRHQLAGYRIVRLGRRRACLTFDFSWDSWGAFQLEREAQEAERALADAITRFLQTDL